ncbi:hypothetical protein F8388_023175 [Cannabis sativa]|uniref:Bet v I/Major latex protein domain-containing protein n=1 Tax=Cannabis sativa TaxID=3483 RepID=A0A7J6HEQ6_CANSA|nr:hypothetical protein F8388_023175 [Cannabis sativa]KAF4396678.1 hypothetical protein G4B88_028992 [Cannabis sativa]
MVSGQVFHELEVKAAANKVWEIYGNAQELGKLVVNNLKGSIQKIEVVEGDGGEFKFKSHKEKYTKVDNEKRVKEVEVIEGGYLELGFTLYRVRFEIIEKDEGCSIIKSTIEYDLKDDSVHNLPAVTLDPLAAIALAVQNQVTKN